MTPRRTTVHFERGIFVSLKFIFNIAIFFLGSIDGFFQKRSHIVFVGIVERDQNLCVNSVPFCNRR